MSHLVAIVGPTAVGKSRLALYLGQVFDGEIVNADSRQIYCYMDIGTAKPTNDEQALVPHHLIDIIDPDESFSLSDYKELAYKTIQDTQQRGKLPLLVGGSGLYVWAVLENWQIPHVPPDLKLRERLERMAAETGGEALYQELLKVDPVAAERIGLNNTRRIIRALEVYRTTGIPFSHLQTKDKPPFKTLILGLTQDRKKLYQKIDRRVDEMAQRGLVHEVENLVKMGYDFDLSAMSAIGYKQVGMFLRNEMTLEEAIARIKFETHRYVRQQYNWFRLKDDRIKWFDADSEPEPQIEALVKSFLEGKSA